MSRMWTGPAYDVLPSKRPCTHVAPNECRRCNGVAAEESLYYRASTSERLAFLRDVAAWNRRREDWATTDEQQGGAA